MDPPQTLPEDHFEKITRYILSVFGKVNLNLQQFDLMMDKMRLDKKNVKNEINFTLLKEIGEASIDGKASDKLIKESLEHYLEL